MPGVSYRQYELLLLLLPPPPLLLLLLLLLLPQLPLLLPCIAPRPCAGRTEQRVEVMGQVGQGMQSSYRPAWLDR